MKYGNCVTHHACDCYQEKLIELESEKRKLSERIDSLCHALRLCIAQAGNPDAAQGCRYVIDSARAALSRQDRAAEHLHRRADFKITWLGRKRDLLRRAMGYPV